MKLKIKMCIRSSIFFMCSSILLQSPVSSSTINTECRMASAYFSTPSFVVGVLLSPRPQRLSKFQVVPLIPSPQPLHFCEVVRQQFLHRLISSHFSNKSMGNVLGLSREYLRYSILDQLSQLSKLYAKNARIR